MGLPLAPALGTPTPAGHSFVFRGVHIEKVVNDYRAGKYMRAPIPKGKVNVPTTTGGRVIRSGPEGLEQTQDSYIISVPTRGQLRYHTIGGEAYQTFSLTGKPIVGGTCQRCCLDFDWSRMGIPLSQEECSGELPAGLPFYPGRRLLVIHYEGCYCSYRCTLGALHDRDRPGYRPSNVHYRESGTILRDLFRLSYPGETLTPAGDTRLLKKFGGSLTYEQYHQTSYRYVPLADVVLAPVKNIYQQLVS